MTQNGRKPSPMVVKMRLDANAVGELLDKHRRYLRNQSGGARAMLRQCDLSGLDLTGGDWTNSEFMVCKFDGATLERAVFRHANLFGSRFNSGNLSGADFEKADLRGAKFELANLTGAHLGGADLREGMVISADITLDGDTGSRFTNAILKGAKLPNARCKSVDFSGALLDGTDFSDADLRNASFHGAELISPILRGAQLAEADLRSAVLQGDVGQRLQNSGAVLPQSRVKLEAVVERLRQHELWITTQGKDGRRLNLSGGNLQGIDLSGRLLAAAKLDHTILVGANLKGANLAAAVLTGANLGGANLAHADLRGADLRFANLRTAMLDHTRQGAMPGLEMLKTLLEFGRVGSCLPAREQPFHPRRQAVAQALAPHHAVVRHPVELDDAARPCDRRMAVPGMRRDAESEQRSGRRRHFGDDILEIVRRAQQPQPAARRLPGFVHIDEDGDELGSGVGMDPAVAGPRLAAHRDHGRAIGEIDGELLGEGGAEIRPLELGDEGGESRAIAQIGQRKAARLGNLRVIAGERGARRPRDEAGHDQPGERLSRQGRTRQCRQVEETRTLRRDRRCRRHAVLLNFRRPTLPQNRRA